MNHQTWEWLVRASWQASVLCGLVLVAQRLLGSRLGAAWRCNLWLLVACRFLLPTSLETPFSLFNLAARPPATLNGTSLVAGNRDASGSGTTATQPQAGLSRAASASRSTGTADLARQNPPVAPRRSIEWRGVLLVLWLAGATGALLWLAASSAWFRWRLRSAHEIQDLRVPGLLAQCAQEMRVSRRVRVLETRAVTSPALYGWWHPRILLPAGMSGNLDTAQLRFVFLHELAHIKRWDIAACGLMMAALVLHWFNPLAWLASRRLRLERELACDALVLRRAGASAKKSYGETLLRLLQEIGRPTFAPGMLGMLRDDGGMRRRMKLIANFTPSTSTAFWPVILFALLGAVGLTDPLAIRGADSAPANAPVGFRLVVDLQDGSHLVGRSEVQSFQVREAGVGPFSSLPLETISSVTWEGRTAVVTPTPPDTDIKRVEFLYDSIPLDSSVGPLSLPVTQIKRLTVAAIPRLTVPMDGLVAFWSGEGSGADATGNHDGTLQNVHFVKGVVGQAFSFNPSSGGWTGIKVPDSPAFELTNSMTIVGWIRPRGDGRVIFFRGDHRPGWDPYLLTMDENTNVNFQIWGADGEHVSVGAPLQTGVWTHVAAVLNDDGGMLSIYTNGVLAAQTNTAVRPFGPLLADQSPGVGIGNLNDGGNSFPYAGDLDEVGLYSRPLSPSEIWAIYSRNSSNAGETAGPFQATPSARAEMGGIRPVWNGGSDGNPGDNLSVPKR